VVAVSFAVEPSGARKIRKQAKEAKPASQKS